VFAGGRKGIEDMKFVHDDSRIGNAYLCSDGLIRWITGRSIRDYYSILWREQDSDVWHHGGVVHADEWQEGTRVENPTGKFKVMGSTGRLLESELNFETVNQPQT
jgi:hypothetical protein